MSTFARENLTVTSMNGNNKSALFCFQNYSCKASKQRMETFSNPADTVCVFALAFGNDSKQADNVVTQLQGILEVAGT